MKSRSTDALTSREQEVIELLSSGLTNEEIARQLGISLDGVKYHVSGIFRRLRVKNRHEAASLHLGTEGGALTPREEEVIELLSSGLTNEEIARQLGISLDGVKYHVSEILRRLKVESRREAASLHLRAARSGRLAALAPVMFLRKLPFGWLGKAAAGAALTTTAAGIALLAWGLISTSNNAVTTTGCRAEQSAGGAPNCAPGVAQAAGGASGITAINASSGYTCALKEGGVWCWGGNQASVPFALLRLENGISAISAGPCFLKGGAVWCWDPPNIDAAAVVYRLESGVSALDSGRFGTCAVKDGGVWCLDQVPEGLTVSGLESGVSAIGVGDDHACAVKDGGVWCWGSNFSRQLGNDGPDSTEPVAVSGLTSGVSAVSSGGAYSCAVKDGGAWCWGDNSKGQLGSTSATNECGLNAFPCSHVPLAVPGLTGGVSAISAGEDHACAVKGGGVWCWGADHNGQVGNGTTTDRAAAAMVLGLASSVQAISAGNQHSCALAADGVWCWGRNSSGQLGNNRPTRSDVPVAVSGLTSGVSAIEDTCALKGGAVWCWGSNDVGQLGNNGTLDSAVPVAVSGLVSGVRAISPGPCALKADGLWCWGRNPGLLGNSSRGQSGVPLPVTGVVKGVSAISGSCVLKGGAVLCLATPDSPALTVLAGLESGVSAIGGECAIKGGGIWCWGLNPANAQGADNRLVPMPMSGLESGVSALNTAGILSGCVIKDGGVWCWSWDGENRPPRALVVSGLESGVSAISAGDDHACAVKAGGVWCWGWRVLRFGGGGGGTLASSVPAVVPELASGVSAISGTCAVKDGGVWCWGDNSNGQLGNNSPADSPVPVAVQFTPPRAGAMAAAAPTDVAVKLPPSSAGDIAPTPDVKPRAAQPSTDSADHRTAYLIGGTAAVALAIVVAGAWAVRRRLRIS